MKLSICAFAATSGIIWCAAVFFVGLANHVWPSYGGAFLEMMSSIYPGYHVSENITSVFIGGGYALVDGFFAGLIFASLYNCLARKKAAAEAK